MGAKRRPGALLAPLALAVLAVGCASGGNGQPAEQTSGGKQSAATDEHDPYADPVPILMYHAIGEAAGGGGLAELWVSAENFVEQMGWLAANGWTGVTLQRVQAAWAGRGTLPDRPIVISFDDGYEGHATIARPVLREHGWPAVNFLKAGLGGLTLEQARALVADGWEIGAHTINHPDLTTVDDETLRAEIYHSGRLLRQALGSKVSNFAYPAGQYDERVVRAVRDAGYDGAVTVDPGWADQSNPLELARIRVPGSGGLTAIQSALGEPRD